MSVYFKDIEKRDPELAKRLQEQMRAIVCGEELPNPVTIDLNALTPEEAHEYVSQVKDALSGSLGPPTTQPTGKHPDPLQAHNDLARIGYVAYGEDADWKNYEGQPMPSWDELPEHIRRKWRAATYRIVQQALTGEWLPENERLQAVVPCHACSKPVISYSALGYLDVARIYSPRPEGDQRFLWYHQDCASRHYKGE